VRQRRKGRKGEEEEKKKRKKRIANTIHVFLLFLHESRILIFIKNNMKIPNIS
jgi:hypothetical protein